MESASTSSRFRFRDHQDMENSSHTSLSDFSSDNLSVTSDGDDETELHSMAGKGIKHLCSELLELKAASNEDFHRNVISNCSAFVRIFQEVEGMENELVKLREYVWTQKSLVRDLVEGIYGKVLLEEATESSLEEPEYSEVSCSSELETHINSVSETLEILISENRIDEALDIIELEEEGFQKAPFEEKYSLDVLMSYNSVISETKAMLTIQLTLVAENSRTSAPELQKALVGLCRLGDCHLATQLLLRYYHSRIANGIYNLQCLKSLLHGVYIRELAKFVFSMIAQAAKSFVMLYGQTSPYASEFVQWVHEETNVFVTCLDKYIKSISEISRGLSTAVEAVQLARSFCSLLETHRLVLQPYLTKLIRPTMEEVLKIHIDHFKKVMNIFTASDSWVLGRYLVTGILNDGYSSVVVGKQPECCLLTNSGRKFLTMLQTVMEDVSTLTALQMESSVLCGLMDLFSEYTAILGRAITWKTIAEQKGGSRISINLAESLEQQVSILANLSTIETFFSGILRTFFKGINYLNDEPMENDFTGWKQQELDSCVNQIQEECDQLRAHFFQQFICKSMSSSAGFKLTSEACINFHDQPTLLHVMPSVPFQVLFLEMRKLVKLSEDNVFEADWLMELLRKLIEAIFVGLSDVKEIWATMEEDETIQHSNNFKQIVVDVQFLVEIVKFGGYFSEHPSILTAFTKSAFISVGIDPERDDIDYSWAIDAARESIQKLLEMERKTGLPPKDPTDTLEEEQHQEVPDNARDRFQDDPNNPLEVHLEPEDDVVSIHISDNVDTASASSPRGASSGILEVETSFNNMVNVTSAKTSEDSDVIYEKAVDPENDELEVTVKSNIADAVSTGSVIMGESEISVSVDESSAQSNAGNSLTMKLDKCASMELPGIGFSSLEDSLYSQGQDESGGEEMAESSVSSEDTKHAQILVFNGTWRF